MSSESESFTPEGAENFVAPDESQRITSPEKAEHMARESHDLRSQAAEHRQNAKDLKEVGAYGVGVESEFAKTADAGAEKWEQFAQMEFEITNEVASLPAAEYPARLEATEKQLHALNRRIKNIENISGGDMGKRSDLLQEMQNEENRLNLYKREYEKGIGQAVKR